MTMTPEKRTELISNLKQLIDELEKDEINHMCNIPRSQFEVYWIISEGNDPDEKTDGEFGVEINGVPYFYYKHAEPSPSTGKIKYRRIEKREFGEVIRRPSE